MLPSMHAVDLLLFLGVVLAWLQAVAYGLAGRDFRARMPAGFFFCAGFWQLEGALSKSGLLLQVPAWRFAAVPFVFLSIPFVYFYFRALLERDFVLSGRHYLHFVPGLLSCGVWIYLLLIPSEMHVRFARRDPELGVIRFLFALFSVGTALGWGYLIFIFVKYIYPGRPRLNAAQKIALGVITAFVLGVLGVEIFRNLHLYRDTSLFLLLHTLFLAVLIIGRLARPGLMVEFAARIRENRARRSRLGSRDPAEIHEELRRLMDRERVYLNENLTLNDLADFLGLNHAQLSEFINREFGRNFNAYVNGYRLEAAEKRLLEKPDESVLDVGLACGFKSSSAFQALFKARAGVSPGRFRKRHS